MNRKQYRNIRCPFTLIEFVVVIVIPILVIAILVVPANDAKGCGKEPDAKTQIGLLDDALSAYKLDVGSYPSSLQCLVTNEDESERWEGPYIKPKVPNDPWGNPYYYVCPGEHLDYDLYTFGADAQEGGKGENADITNWDLQD